jgi:hypothetical protein
MRWANHLVGGTTPSPAGRPRPSRPPSARGMQPGTDAGSMAACLDSRGMTYGDGSTGKPTAGASPLGRPTNPNFVVRPFQSGRPLDSLTSTGERLDGRPTCSSTTGLALSPAPPHPWPDLPNQVGKASLVAPDGYPRNRFATSRGWRDRSAPSTSTNGARSGRWLARPCRGGAKSNTGMLAFARTSTTLAMNFLRSDAECRAKLCRRMHLCRPIPRRLSKSGVRALTGQPSPTRRPPLCSRPFPGPGLTISTAGRTSGHVGSFETRGRRSRSGRPRAVPARRRAGPASPPTGR